MSEPIRTNIAVRVAISARERSRHRFVAGSAAAGISVGVEWLNTGMGLHS
jgi:hypothetical protein